jgi:hypothetical protein
MEENSVADNVDNPEIERYIRLIEAFLNKKVIAAEFELQYLKMFKNETHQFSESVFLTLDRLFSDVDSYSPRPSGNAEIDEATLRKCCLATLTQLRLGLNGDKAVC